jgi:hypothetical protein
MEKISGKIQENQSFLQAAREFPVWQNVTIATASWFWIFSVVHNIYTVIEWDFNDKMGAAYGFFLAFCFYAGGIFFPSILTYSLGIEIFKKLNEKRGNPRSFKKIMYFVAWITFGCLSLVGSFAVIHFIEKAFYPMSIVPFVTTTSALFWLGVGQSLFPKNGAAKHPVFLALMVIIILTGEYLDLNSRKPFIRDLYTVKVGMTGIDVKNIMGKYDKQVNLYSPRTYEYLNADFTGQESFRHTDEGWGNADAGTIKFHDGRVLQVEFSHD